MTWSSLETDYHFRILFENPPDPAHFSEFHEFVQVSISAFQIFLEAFQGEILTKFVTEPKHTPTVGMADARLVRKRASQTEKAEKALKIIGIFVSLSSLQL